MPGLARSVRFVVGSLVTLALAGAVIGPTWYAVQRSTATQRLDAIRRTNAIVTALAASYADQIGRQTLALDQTLDMMVRDWEADPRRFNLETERARAVILKGVSRDMFLADENGIIRQSSVPDFIGQSVADLDVFRDAAEHTNNKPSLFLGGASVNPIMRQWHLDAARTLHHPDGSFAGIIDADYRVSALTDMVAAAPPAGDGFAAVIGLSDGKLRASWGGAGGGPMGGSGGGPGATATGTPDANIADTKMFGALDTGDSGVWTGPSATDATVRIHGFRRIPNRDLAVMVGMSQQETLAPAEAWHAQSRLFAGAVTGLTAVLAIMVIGMLRAGRRREAMAAESRAHLAAAHALAEVSRAHADAIERRLHATFSAITDGVAIFDAHLNLIEWNALFPERSGVNASFIRTGMPMEDVLKSQAMAGCFGEVGDVDAEVDRRITLLRAGTFGASLSFQAAGRVIELRCRPLPEGGFVALYTDVTDARRARQALRDRRDVLRREQSTRMRFLDVISHELSARVALLTRSLGRLRGTATGSLNEEALVHIRRVADSLASLASDTVEVPLMEAGAVVPHPALIAVRPLLAEIVDAIEPAARDRGITTYQVVNETTPAELIADPDRIRQILTVLLSEALRFAGPDTMWLMADGGEDEPGDQVALRVTIRGFGPPISDAIRAGMFPAFDAVAVPEPSEGHVMGTGLGPAIARHLTALMGGQLRCERWSTIDGRTGNDFILTLPPELLPGQRGRAPGQAPAEGRPLPRTRVLLVGNATGVRMAAVTMLRRDGHMVDAAATVEAAVHALDIAPYDVVFIDSVLPDATVEATLDTIRDMAGPARLAPLIVLAPPHLDAEEHAWRDAGAVDVLPANPTLEELAGAIARHVWLSRSFGPVLGFMPGLQEEQEEGIPILSTARIVELRSNLPREELLDMAEECIADMFHRMPALRRALATGSAGAITAQTHAMVGMAGGYGMAVLEARLRAILTAVRGRRLDTIDGAAAVVEADLTRAAAALRRALRMPRPAQSGVPT